MPHKDNLDALEKLLEEHEEKKIPMETLLQLAEFVLNNNFSESGSKIVQQKSGTAVGTKFTPINASIFMTSFESL